MAMRQPPILSDVNLTACHRGSIHESIGHDIRWRRSLTLGINGAPESCSCKELSQIELENRRLEIFVDPGLPDINKTIRFCTHVFLGI